MRGRSFGWLLGVLALLLWAAPAWAASPPTVRIGDHPGFVRVVYEFSTNVDFTATEQLGVLVVTFATDATVPDGPHAPRNVLEVIGAAGESRLRLAPGTHWRSLRLGSRIVIDVLDRPRAPPTRAAPTGPVQRLAPPPIAASAAPVATPPPFVREAQTPPATQGAAEPAAPPTAAPVTPVRQEPLPSPPAAPIPPAPGAGKTRAELAAGALVLPFESGVGAAAFRYGDTALLVFDDRRAIDLSPARDDPVWGRAVVQLLPEATLVRMPWPDGALTLRRVEGGWSVAAGQPPADLALPRVIASGLLLPGHAPGRVVAVPAEPGRRLLVGTWRDTPGAVVVVRRMPEFALLPAWQGVVVDPVSDQIALAARTEGFIVTSGTTVLGAAVAAGAGFGRHPVAMSRVLDLPTGSTPELLHRLQSQVASAARAGAQARTQDRLAAAQTMLALALGPEAQALLQAASAQDPEAAGTDAMAAASAIAAILSGRPGEATVLDEPRFAGNDEAGLWRAIRDSGRTEATPAMAKALAAGRPLLDAYPDELRARLSPRIAEAMASGGEAEAAEALTKSHDGDPRFDLARAIRRVQAGDAESALPVLDRLATGSDARQRARAMAMAAESRLSTKQIDASAAADVMERAAYAWRGEDGEARLRLRSAELRTQSGAWRPALDGLREAASLFPADRPAIRAHMADVFRAMLAGAQMVRPADLVTLAGQYPDVLPDGEAGASLAGQIADALVALDLPGRAGPVLDGMMRAAVGSAKSALGARLAALQLEDRQPAASLATLAGSQVDDAPAELLERRALIHARARAVTDPGGATAELAAIASPAADDIRARLLEAAQDWQGARAALSDLLGKTPPADAPGIVLRLATAVARSDDAIARKALREQWQAKLPPGAQADLFRVLTAEPVREPADLKRGAQEIALARALPR